MKEVFGVIIAVCVAGYLAEVCTVNSDCASTTCSLGNTVVCQHPTGAGVTTDGGLCTCAATGAANNCSGQADCLDADITLPCANSERHCYDGFCICDRFPGVGR